jgi:hypothetical protein
MLDLTVALLKKWETRPATRYRMPGAKHNEVRDG